jgi:hypothetical protein
MVNQMLAISVGGAGQKEFFFMEAACDNAFWHTQPV